MADQAPPLTPSAAARAGAQGPSNGRAGPELLRLKDLLLEHHGEVPVALELRLDDDSSVTVAAHHNFKVAWTPALAAALDSLLGPGRTRERRAAPPPRPPAAPGVPETSSPAPF